MSWNNETKVRHGHARAGAKSPEYLVWEGMRARCRNPRHVSYSAYGGRGITVCERWKSFANFLADMGSRPSSKYTLERRDNDKGYEPDNCEWCPDRKTQSTNMRSNVFVEVSGRKMICKHAAKSLGLNDALIRSRLHRGWSIERAFEGRAKAAQ